MATDEEKKAAEETAKANDDLLSALKEALGDKVEKVAISTRLAADGAPAVITSEGPLSLEMEQVLSAGPESGDVPRAQRVLEINAQHPVFEKLRAAKDADDSDKINLYAALLYDQALLVEGMMPEDPVAFASKVCELM